MTAALAATFSSEELDFLQSAWSVQSAREIADFLTRPPAVITSVAGHLGLVKPSARIALSGKEIS